MKINPAWKKILIIFGVLYFIASILLLIDDIRQNNIVGEMYATPGCAEHFMVPANR
jgi:hypothetical protein